MYLLANMDIIGKMTFENFLLLFCSAGTISLFMILVIKIILDDRNDKF